VLRVARELDAVVELRRQEVVVAADGREAELAGRGEVLVVGDDTADASTPSG
jgi:hypothetical protein